jgi:hypothetical protein
MHAMCQDRRIKFFLEIKTLTVKLRWMNPPDYHLVIQSFRCASHLPGFGNGPAGPLVLRGGEIVLLVVDEFGQ